MTYTTDYDGTVVEQPETDTTWVPCVQCGKRTHNVETLICADCRPPAKGIRCLELKGGRWERDAGGVMRWVE